MERNIKEGEKKRQTLRVKIYWKKLFSVSCWDFQVRTFYCIKGWKKEKKERKTERETEQSIEWSREKDKLQKSGKSYHDSAKKRHFSFVDFWIYHPVQQSGFKSNANKENLNLNLTGLVEKARAYLKKKWKNILNCNKISCFTYYFIEQNDQNFYGKSDVPTLIHSKVNASSCISGVPLRSKLHGIHWGLRIIFSFSIFQQFSIGTLLLQNNVFQFFNCYRNTLKLNFLCHFLPKFTRFLCLSFKNTFSEKFNFENITYQLY